MRGDPEALTVEFFDKWGAELPSPCAREVDEVGKMLLKNHKRSRLGGLFRLHIAAANASIGQAGVEDADAFRLTMEDTAGFTFEKPTVPE